MENAKHGNTFSEKLIANIRDIKQTSTVIDGGRLPVVLANLKYLYDAVVASEQLLIDAASGLEVLPGNAYHTLLTNYFRSHLEEERDHASWLREDLHSAGVSPGFPDRMAMAMVGSQYYMLKHLHPAALLGYMAVLEGDPVPLEVVNMLESAHGKDMLRFVRIHAHKDIEHCRELTAVIDHAPDTLRALIASSAENTLYYFVQASATWGAPTH